jgi:hypothetical protein
MIAAMVLGVLEIPRCSLTCVDPGASRGCGVFRRGFTSFFDLWLHARLHVSSSALSVNRALYGNSTETLGL